MIDGFIKIMNYINICIMNIIKDFRKLRAVYIFLVVMSPIQIRLFNRVNDIINHFQNAPENIIEYLKFNAKFHQYSSNNTILIYEQNHMARFCASYKTFKDMGYQVQKGQTGMKILVPQLLTLWYDEKLQEWKKLSESTKEEKEKVKNNEVKTKRITMFGVGTVFDIGQTDCPTSDYPKLFDVGFASETHSRLYAAVVHYAESKGIAVEEQFFPSITQRGYYSRDNNLIAISDKLEDSMKLSVITHELSHALMHSNPEAAELPMEQKEIEADSLSLMLRDHLGITEIEDVRQNHLQAAYKLILFLILHFTPFFFAVFFHITVPPILRWLYHSADLKKGRGRLMRCSLLIRKHFQNHRYLCNINCRNHPLRLQCFCKSQSLRLQN